MPLQNRVTPFGTLIATSSRGAWMGNRGVLHNADKTLSGRRWTTQAWVTCRLSFKGRQRRLMTPGRYTELFFLDEATALAAGHRPCFECRRGDALAFRQAWQQASGVEKITASEMNRKAHPERTQRPEDRPKAENAAALPHGAFVFQPDHPDVALLVANGMAWRWTPSGYVEPRTADGLNGVILTPASSLAVLAAGYPVEIHHSAIEYA